MDERKDIELKKIHSKFKKDSRIRECFHYDKTACSDQIILAHSIQKNGVLSLLESDVEGNLSIFSFLHFVYDTYGSIIGFEALGKKTASTFTGFCGYHDTILFQEIENNPVDIENDQHCFLLSYRAFSKEYHAKQETLQGYRINDLYQQAYMKNRTSVLISGSELGRRDSLKVKNRLNEILHSRSYEELEYFTYILDYTIPMALATSINPNYSYRNKKLNKSNDPNIVYEFVNFIIHPTNTGQTFILFSCLPEHKKSILFMDDLVKLNSTQLQYAISSIAIAYVENTFISPTIWQQLEETEKRQLMN